MQMAASEYQTTETGVASSINYDDIHQRPIRYFLRFVVASALCRTSIPIHPPRDTVLVNSDGSRAPRIGHATALSSLSAPLATIRGRSSDRGLAAL